MPTPKRQRTTLVPYSDCFTEAEYGVIFEVMRAGNFGSAQSAVRCALWKLADHLDVPMTTETFKLSASHRYGSSKL